MRIDVVTLFPRILEVIFEDSILRRAKEKGLVDLHVWNLRDFATDRHRTVDDYPYGGGPGMILKPEPFFRAVERIREEATERPKERKKHPFKVIFMTPQGGQYNQAMAEALSKESHLVFLCGHYRGVDERVIEGLVDQEISIGDYILTGGELPVAVVIDSIVRLLPGALGNFDSAEKDSFMSGLLDHPHYTRPEEFQGRRVPEVLLSGHHAKIHEWREQQAFERTKKRRPDLLASRLR